MAAAGMDESSMARWHIEFERRAPKAHNEFLMSLGIPKNEVRKIQEWSRANKWSHIIIFHKFWSPLFLSHIIKLRCKATMFQFGKHRKNRTIFCTGRQTTIACEKQVGFVDQEEINSDNEVALIEWHLPKLCIWLYVHRWYGETSILKVASCNARMDLS